MIVVVFMAAGCNLITRAYKETNPRILVLSYNLLTAIVFGCILFYNYLAFGEVPLSSITDTSAVLLLLFSAITNVLA